MQQKQYDRSAEDVGNIVALEHVNLRVEDQGLATLFYVSGLGLTRDPYMMTSIDNMWINVGKSQFHLPTGGPAQVLRGRVGLVVDDREHLLQRLGNMKKLLGHTRFAFTEKEGVVETTCPWGNTILCHDARPGGAFTLGISYVEFDVAPGAAQPIAEFYRRIFGTMASATGGTARVSVGIGQELVFRETDSAPADYDGHHIQVYVANFSAPHRALKERGLITEESNQHQYRFEEIVDLDGNRPLFRIEHEVRSLRNPMYARPLMNRNPRQTNRAYVPGRDYWVPEPVAVEMDNPRQRAREASREQA
jgi:hypothetical protein